MLICHFGHHELILLLADMLSPSVAEPEDEADDDEEGEQDPAPRFETSSRADVSTHPQPMKTQRSRSSPQMPFDESQFESGAASHAR